MKYLVIAEELYGIDLPAHYIATFLKLVKDNSADSNTEDAVKKALLALRLLK